MLLQLRTSLSNSSWLNDWEKCGYFAPKYDALPTSKLACPTTFFFLPLLHFNPAYHWPLSLFKFYPVHLYFSSWPPKATVINTIHLE